MIVGGSSSEFKVCGEDSTQSWDTKKHDNRTKSSWGQSSNGSKNADGWSTCKASGDGVSSTWAQLKSSSEGAEVWSKACGEGGSGSWDSQKEENKTKSCWGKQKNNKDSAGHWNVDKASEEGDVSG